MDAEKRQRDEMMNFLPVGIQWLVTSCNEPTPPPNGAKETHIVNYYQWVLFTEFGISRII